MIEPRHAPPAPEWGPPLDLSPYLRVRVRAGYGQASVVKLGDEQYLVTHKPTLTADGNPVGFAPLLALVPLLNTAIKAIKKAVDAKKAKAEATGDKATLQEVEEINGVVRGWAKWG